MSMESLSLLALPPYAQELCEKEAIAKDPQVIEYLHTLNTQISNIYKTSATHYVVELSDYTIRVDVIYTHDEKLFQPKNFKLQVFAPKKNTF